MHYFTRPLKDLNSIELAYCERCWVMVFVSKWVCSVRTRRLWWQLIKSVRYCLVCIEGLNLLIRSSSKDRSSETLQVCRAKKSLVNAIVWCLLLSGFSYRLPDFEQPLFVLLREVPELGKSLDGIDEFWDGCDQKVKSSDPGGLLRVPVSDAKLVVLVQPHAFEGQVRQGFDGQDTPKGEKKCFSYSSYCIFTWILSIL